MKQVILFLTFFQFFAVYSFAQSGTSIQLGGTCISGSPATIPYDSDFNGRPMYYSPSITIDGTSTDARIFWSGVTHIPNNSWLFLVGGGTVAFFNSSNTPNPNSTNIEPWTLNGVISCESSITITGTGTIDAPTNTAPTASSFTANPSENSVYTFATGDFGYNDGDGDPLNYVLIEALPTAGTLYVDANNNDGLDGGEAVSVSSQISKADLDAGNLQYIQNGATNTGFQFEVNDGTDTSTGDYVATLTMIPAPNLTINDLAASINLAENTVNSTPQVIDNTLSLTGTPSTTSATVTVRFTSGGTANDRLGIGGLVDGRAIRISGTTPVGSFTGGVGMEPLVIDFISDLSLSELEGVLERLTYANVSQNPTTTARVVEISYEEAGTPTVLASTTINLSQENDAPFFTQVYPLDFDANPIDAIGWQSGASGGNFGTDFIIGSAGNSGILNSTPSNTDGVQAGFFTPGFTPGSGFALPPLDRTEGFAFNFTAQILAETSSGGNNKNPLVDNKRDRAGFSVLLVTSDLRAISMMFFTDRIAVLEDGTTQINPSLEPDDGSDPNQYSLLFTQAESVTYNTSAAPSAYSITVLGDTYTLKANGVTILSGKLRNYSSSSASVFGVVNPYQVPNLIFMGDDSPSARANLTLANISLASGVTARNLGTILENSPNGTSVGMLTGNDVDDNTTLSYSLGAGNTSVDMDANPAFAVSGSTVVVNDQDDLRFSQSPSFTITATLSDGSLTDNQQVIINLSPVEVEVSANITSTEEDNGQTLTFTFTSIIAVPDDLTIDFSVSGTALLNDDYYYISGADTFSSSTGKVTISAGQTSAQVVLQVKQDGILEGDETIVLTIQTP